MLTDIFRVAAGLLRSPAKVQMVAGGRQFGKSYLARYGTWARCMVESIPDEERQARVNRLVEYIRSDEFSIIRSTFSRRHGKSSDGFVSITSDIYGLEVNLLGRNSLLDCHYHDYNLTQKLSAQIFDALMEKWNASGKIKVEEVGPNA